MAETGLGGPKGRGREFQPAATSRFDPSDIVGKTTKKHFKGYGTFIGEIVSVSAEGWYSIRYSDGDVEEVVRRMAQNGIKRYEEGSYVVCRVRRCRPVSLSCQNGFTPRRSSVGQAQRRRTTRQPHCRILRGSEALAPMALAAVSRPVVVDGDSFLDALFASAGQD